MKKIVLGLVVFTGLLFAGISDFWRSGDSYVTVCTNGYKTTITPGNSNTWCTTDSNGKSSCDFNSPHDAASWACR